MTIKTCLAAALVVVGCSGKKPEEGLEPPVPAPTPPPADAGAGSGSAKPAEKLPTVIKDAGFLVPESVLYDADADVYLVANINDTPFKTDDNGFISRVSPEGKVTELKWIDGAKPDVTLNAPKGMAISGGMLWVADITTVRKFDAKTGKPMGEVKVAGATFLNDVVADGKDGIFVSDTAFTEKYEPGDAQAIHQIDKAGKVTVHRKDKALAGPNGLAVDGDRVLLVTFGSGELVAVPAKGDITLRAKLPTGQLDGIIALGSGEYLISSWEGKTAYRGTAFKDGKPDATWTDLKLAIESPADIGYDTKRKRLLVPSFSGNTLTLIDL